MNITKDSVTNLTDSQLDKVMTKIMVLRKEHKGPKYLISYQQYMDAWYIVNTEINKRVKATPLVLTI